MEVIKLSPAAGAEIRGVDLSRPFTDEEFQTVREAMADHLVLSFPDQDITPEAFIAFGKHWGELLIHPNLTPSSIDPALIEIQRRPGDKRFTGSEWHTDATMIPAPPKFTMMHSKVVPSVGGDTLFANQYMAYEGLSEGMKSELRRLRAVHNDERVAGPQAGLNAQRTNQTNEREDWTPTVTVHPLVRTHPETGRDSLYANIAYTAYLEGMTREESAPLLDFLFEQNHRFEYTYRHKWQKDMVVIWDNRALVHIAANDCPDDHRLMHRLQVIGEPPYLKEAS